MGFTTASTCWRCAQPLREANYGGHVEHNERDCFDAVMERVKKLEGQMAILARCSPHWAMVEKPRCTKCGRAPEIHPQWDCQEFVP